MLRTITQTYAAWITETIRVDIPDDLPRDRWAAFIEKALNIECLSTEQGDSVDGIASQFSDDAGPLPRPTYTWRRTPAGALVMSNAEGADVAHVYLAPSGKFCGDPWGRERRYFDGPGAEADARAYVEAAFR